MPLCPLCTDPSDDIAFRLKGFRYHRCRACHAVFVDLQIDKAEVHALYSEDYYESDDSEKTERQGYPSYRKTHDTLSDGFRTKLAFVQRFVKSGRLLDIGAAYGFFVNVAASAFVSEGVEISPYAVHLARTEYHANVEIGDAEHLDKPSEEFDAVTMWDIIEHLPNPRKALEEIHRILKPGGFLFVSTDDVSNWLPHLLGRRWWGWAPPLHLCHFSKAGLTIAAQHAGLEAPRYFPDRRIYAIPEIVKHFGVSYQNAWLDRIGSHLETTLLNRLKLRLSRPEQFIAVIRKPL